RAAAVIAATALWFAARASARHVFLVEMYAALKGGANIRLEVQPQCELSESPLVRIDAFSGPKPKAALLTLDQNGAAAIVRCVGEGCHDVHVRVIENVVPFCPELQRKTFRECERFGHTQIKIPGSWTIEHIPRRHVGRERTKVRKPVKCCVGKAVRNRQA